MCLQPKDTSRSGWIDAGLCPPGGLIATAMHLAVMSAAKRNRKLVADLAAECRYLRKPQVVSISGASAANQTGLLGNRCNVLAVANATLHRQGQYTFIDKGGAPLFTSPRATD